MESLTIKTLSSTIGDSHLTKTLNDFSKNTSIVESDIGNQNIIFNNLSEDVYVMNVTGKIIWHVLNKQVEIKDIINTFKAWFTGGVDEDESIGDVEYFIAKLEAEGLIFVGENKDRGGFPVGRVINFTQNQKNVKYEKPKLIKYDRVALREKHPEIFYRTQFSDTWGPATEGED